MALTDGAAISNVEEETAIISTAGQKILKNPGKKSREIFFRKIAFLAVSNFFPVQKLIFAHFSNCKKWILVKKYFS